MQHIYHHNQVAQGVQPMLLDKALLKASRSYDLYMAGVKAKLEAEHKAAVLKARQLKSSVRAAKVKCQVDINSVIHKVKTIEASPFHKGESSELFTTNQGYVKLNKRWGYKLEQYDVLFTENRCLAVLDWLDGEQQVKDKQAQVKLRKQKKQANKLKALHKKTKQVINIQMPALWAIYAAMQALLMFQLIKMLCTKTKYKTNTKPTKKMITRAKTIKVNHPVDRKLVLEARWLRRAIYDIVVTGYSYLDMSFTQTAASSVTIFKQAMMQELAMLEDMITCQRNSIVTKMVIVQG